MMTNAKGAVVQKFEEGFESLGRKLRRAREARKAKGEEKK